MEERMIILNLLEKGKVSVDEAARLIEALGSGNECCLSDLPTPPVHSEEPEEPES